MPVPRTRPSVEALEDRCLLSGGLSARVADSLYVGDGSDNTVKKFDATTGAFQDTLVTSGSQGLNGPRGLIFRNDGQLLVVNQNVFLPIPGEVLRYNGVTGVPLGALVPASDPNAPFAPRGMVLGAHHTLYVADDGNLDGITLGRLTRFNSETGAFLGDLKPTGFTGDFYARGVVIGPDGLVYASVRNIAPTGGEIMRWDPVSGNFLGSFVTSDATNDLNRPEGIVFGPDGNLYVTSFRANSSDTDKIEEFNGTTGAYIGKIDTDQVGQPREFGQALLFGPGGKLFVPITALGSDSGEVRRYDVSTGTFDVFVPPNALGGPLGQPWYLTFGQTDASTLAYGEESHPATATLVSGAWVASQNHTQATERIQMIITVPGPLGGRPQAQSALTFGPAPGIRTAGANVDQSSLPATVRQSAANDRLFADWATALFRAGGVDDLALAEVA